MMSNVEMINVGGFSTTTGRSYDIIVRKNGKSLKSIQVIGCSSGSVLDVANLGTYLSQLKERKQLIKWDVNWKKIEELTGKDHSHPALK